MNYRDWKTLRALISHPLHNHTLAYLESLEALLIQYLDELRKRKEELSE